MTGISSLIHKEISLSIIYSLIASCVFLPHDFSHDQDLIRKQMLFGIGYFTSHSVRRAPKMKSKLLIMDFRVSSNFIQQLVNA
jgi:hypothetical protein